MVYVTQTRVRASGADMYPSVGLGRSLIFRTRGLPQKDPKLGTGAGTFILYVN